MPMLGQPALICHILFAMFISAGILGKGRKSGVDHSFGLWMAQILLLKVLW